MKQQKVNYQKIIPSLAQTLDYEIIRSNKHI